MNFADDSRNYQQILTRFFESWDVPLTSNKPFSFGADPDRDPDAGIFKRNFTTAG